MLVPVELQTHRRETSYLFWLADANGTKRLTLYESGAEVWCHGNLKMEISPSKPGKHG
jgi:hypothetical protein